MDFTIGKDFIETKRQGVYLRVEAWSKNAIRVRATLEKEFKPFDWSICKKQKNLPVTVQENKDGACLTNGKINVQLSNVTQAHNEWLETPLTFYNAETGKELLRERRARSVLPSIGHILKKVWVCLQFAQRPVLKPTRMSPSGDWGTISTICTI